MWNGDILTSKKPDRPHRLTGSAPEVLRFLRCEIMGFHHSVRSTVALLLGPAILLGGCGYLRRHQAPQIADIPGHFSSVPAAAQQRQSK